MLYMLIHVYRPTAFVGSTLHSITLHSRAPYLNENVRRGEGERRVVLEHEVLHVGADTAHHGNDHNEQPGGRLIVFVPLVESAEREWKAKRMVKQNGDVRSSGTGARGARRGVGEGARKGVGAQGQAVVQRCSSGVLHKWTSFIGRSGRREGTLFHAPT